MTRSGTLVQFAIRKNHAVLGTLVAMRDGSYSRLSSARSHSSAAMR